MKRISAIADWICGPVLADVGADHGLLCLQAVQKGKASKAYAIDISEKALAKARENIEQAGLTRQIETRVENGLENLAADVNQIVMAGLGARTMMEILAENPVQIPLLLSPHKDVVELRAWLIEHGYQIIREKMIFEGHFYPLLEIQPNRGKEKQSLSPQELYGGVHVEDSLDYRAFLKHEIKIWKERLPRLSGKRKEEINLYLKALEKRLESLEKSRREDAIE